MTIKVVSLNIWLGGYLQDSAINFLKEQNADIIVLQEVFNGEESALDRRYRTLQIIKERLGFPYEDFVPNHDQPDNNAPIGNAIISRFPIVSPLSGDYLDHSRFYNLQHVTIDAPTDMIDVFNLHGAWDLDGDNFSPVRQEMSHQILEAIKNKKNVILAGDTNAKPTNKAIMAINERLKSVFGNELTTTFNMRHKDDEGYASAAVDMMFVSPHILVIEHICPNVDISDHLPLVASLQAN